MASKQKPRLMLGPLTGRIYCATRYKDLGGGKWEALEKFDVTNNFFTLYEEATARFNYTPKSAGGRRHG